MRSRDVLVQIALALSIVLSLGCTRDRVGSNASARARASSALPSPSNSTGVTLAPAARQLRSTLRAACGFGPGALPQETLDEDMPRGERLPIDHFIVVMQENRSFDHYFQKLPEFGQPDVEVAPATYENPNPTGEGAMVRPFLLRDVCVADVPHNWIAVRHQIGRGAMNGFVAAANPNGTRALGYYGPDRLNFYYTLARTFAIGDRYFASMPGPTYPNRMFALSASSFGHLSNTPPPPRDEERSIFHQLEKRGLSWIVYADKPTFEEKIFPRLRSEKGGHFRTISDFESDSAAGRLPSLAWVEPTFDGVDATDEHAPANVQLGQAFVARVVAAFTQSPSWTRSALFLTYDEHGGFFDHVPPPEACPPRDRSPAAARTGSVHFDHLGVRVPFIVVSPFARAHYVSHRVHSHTSVLRLVQARFDLPALSERDANDVPPYDMFDFSRPSFPAPPPLPAAEIDRSERARCHARSTK